MLGIGDVRVPVCDGVTRRSFLVAGSAGIGGLSLPGMMTLEAAGAVDPSKSEIRNCITIFLVGSPGHLDTWDMKPEAPAEIRGKFQPIDTNVPGIQICEHFPFMARMMDKVALIRSLHHKTGATHENGQRWMMTGHDFNPDSVKPHCGSVISRVFGNRGTLPASVVLPAKIGNTGAGPLHGQSAGYLGSAHEPFFLGSDPARSDFKVSDLTPPAGHTEFRLNSRRELLRQVDEVQRKVETNSAMGRDTAYSRAYQLLTSPEAKQAFDLSQEKPELRDRYGRNTLGQSCLMARRLVERGCRHITVNHFDTVFGISCWDMHADGGGLNNTYADYERVLCPQFDLAFTALIEDLEQRGLLNNTVVCVLSEMGRTPNLNPRGGRDHHTTAWTNFLVGGPIKGGQVIGSTDKIGMRPQNNPIEPPQILASIYHAMGIDLDNTMMPGPGSRPIRLVEAEPISQLF